ncbi:Rha family transcriptional regulator [Burkholderia sp. PAMC 28687]|uniref:Rha family transcriptional regulator n=1 Tax=Burkholderia sp. PAMC 28687 TaxID=1795874 RepID=UPI0009E663AA
MSSREIAERTHKQHKNVLADIRKMIEGLDLTLADFSADLADGYGRLQPGYNLPKRECMILVSGYNVRLRAAIVDRWQELACTPLPS